MVRTSVFLKWWIGTYVSVLTIIAVIGVLIIVFTKGSETVEASSMSSLGKIVIFVVTDLVVVSGIFGYLGYKNRLIVQPEWNYIFSWNGRKMEPLVPGVYYPFPFLGFKEEVSKVPMNRQMLCILSGERNGMDMDIVNEYVYGNASNLEPSEGSALRLQYKVEIQCFDPTLLTYSQSDPYAYIAGVIESKINKYVHGRRSEKIIDGFTKRKWDTILLPEVRAIISPIVGVDLLSFIPVDVILTPENEKSRSDVEIEERKIKLLEVQLKKQVKEEEGQDKILNARLVNMAKKIEIGKKDDEVRANTIESVKLTAGVNGVVALGYMSKDKLTETVGEASKKGSILFVDGSGKGNLSEAASLAFAVTAANQNP